MNKSVRFVFVLYYPTVDQRRRAWDIVVDNTEHNRGYGGAANIGIRQALAEGAEWVVVCNQDIGLTKKGVETLVTTLSKSEPGVIGPEVGKFDPKRWTTIMPTKGSIEYVSGSCMAIHREVIEKVGLFWEPYFMYYEDSDFSVRAKKAGFPIRYIKLDGFRHDRTIASKRRKKWYLARNHLLFVLRNAPRQVKLHELLRLPKTFYEYWR